MLKNEKILITGPSSQVALPIARELARENTVYGLARLSAAADRERLASFGVRCIQSDLATDTFASLPDDFTYVLNFAVVKSGDANFDYDLAANAEGVGRLMSRLRRAKAWLHCSSGGVYQYAGREPRKESDPLGDNHRTLLPTYSICKIAAETVVRFACREWNIPTTIARLSVPYGDNGGWPSMHIESMLAGGAVIVNPDQPNVYNPIHEDDYIAHIPRLLEIASVPATVLNWGGSDPVSIEDWCTYAGELIGVAPQFMTSEMAFGSITLDLTRMHEFLGRTKVPWRDGIRRMMQSRYPQVTLRA